MMERAFSDTHGPDRKRHRATAPLREDLRVGIGKPLLIPFRSAANDGGAEPSRQTLQKPHSVSTPRGGDGKTYAAPRT